MEETLAAGLAAVRRRAPAPQPASVRGNDWRRIAVPAAARFEPRLPVSVVVSYFEAPRELDLVLAGLERQTYPRRLFEVVVVDDGSEPPLERPDTPLDVRVVRQERRGFGLARARNRGADAARHGIVVFLDGDVVAAPGLLAAHARWHHVLSDAVTLGFRAHVSTADLDVGAVRDADCDLGELFERRRTPAPAWRRRLLADTEDLAAPDDRVFCAMVGCNFAVSKAFYDEVGGSDPTFRRWGLEDTEFAYRAYNRGGLLVPVRDANVWHLGPFDQDSAGKRASYGAQRDKVAHLVAHPLFRDAVRGRSFTVPRHVVSVRVGKASAPAVARTVDALLGAAETDLVVRLEFDAASDRVARARLRERFGPDPRVRLTTPARTILDEFPATPLHISLAPGSVPPRLLERLRAGLGDAAVGAGRLGDGRSVAITRAWALHRAARTGLHARDFGAVVSFRIETRAGAGLRRAVGGTRRMASTVRGAAAAAVWRGRRVRDLRSAADFLAWTVEVCLRYRRRSGE